MSPSSFIHVSWQQIKPVPQSTYVPCILNRGLVTGKAETPSYSSWENIFFIHISTFLHLVLFFYFLPRQNWFFTAFETEWGCVSFGFAWLSLLLWLWHDSQRLWLRTLLIRNVVRLKKVSKKAKASAFLDVLLVIAAFVCVVIRAVEHYRFHTPAQLNRSNFKIFFLFLQFIYSYAYIYNSRTFIRLI